MCAYIVVNSNSHKTHRVVFASRTSQPTSMPNEPWGSGEIRGNVFLVPGSRTEVKKPCLSWIE